MNLIQIAGHLGADPETRFTPSGQKVTNLRVAASSRRGNKDETIWWKVTIWGDRFDKLLPYLKKGSSVIIIGEMSKPEIYIDKEGNPQVTLNLTAEMVKFSPFGKGDKQGSENSYTQNASQNSGDAGYGSFSQENASPYGYSPPTPSAPPYGYSPPASSLPGYGQQVPSGFGAPAKHGADQAFEMESDDLPF